MNQTNCSSLLFLCLAVAGGGCCAATSTGGTATIVDDRSEKVPRALLEAAYRYTTEKPVESAEGYQRYWLNGGGAVAGGVAPKIGGRLMFFGTTPSLSPWSVDYWLHQTNLLWSAPEGAAPDAGWNNHGGEKTWVGDMSLWRGFDPKGRRWPPPAWFDQDELEVVASSSTGLVLRSGVHTNGEWRVALERAFHFEGDRLVIRESLLSDSTDGPSPNDPRRVWSVTQVPFAPRLAARTLNPRRISVSGGFPRESAFHGAWVEFDLAGAPEKAALACDADALAVEGPAGWLVVSQRADARFLGAFGTPGRALVYTTGAKPDDPAAAYTELEFVALGRDAAHEISFALAAEPPWEDGSVSVLSVASSR
jgi:hypothetical protein